MKLNRRVDGSARPTSCACLRKQTVFEAGGTGPAAAARGVVLVALAAWRKAAHNGSLAALSKKRGRKPVTAGSKRAKGTIRKLERENARLREELRKARIVIDVQGKVAGRLGLSLERGKNS